MKYIAYGAEPELVKVMVDSETVHIRMARNYQPPDKNDDQSTGQWEETYQEISSESAPTADQVYADFETWWSRGEIWTDTAKTLEDRISKVEMVIDGAPPLAEMIEALTILLEE